jgi:hypothetical protein
MLRKSFRQIKKMFERFRKPHKFCNFDFVLFVIQKIFGGHIILALFATFECNWYGRKTEQQHFTK